ncbi:MAG: DUF4250 domain-containing protein [Muribaculaceae bacterium]|jgi:hypothetical protein
MTLPTDPYILLSYINTKLRDEYPSLEALCDNLDIDAEEISQRLSDAGFSYNPEINQFR